MYTEKQVLDFFNSYQKKIKEGFETRYGITDRKRKLDYLINKFPNGLEVILFEIEKMKDADSIMVLKYNPNNSEKPLKFHGYFKLKIFSELKKTIKKLYKINWDIELKKDVLAATFSDENGHYFYLKNEIPITEILSSYYELNLSHGFNEMFQLSIEGENDQIHSIKLEDMWNDFKKIVKIPKNKSFIIFDLPFTLNLEKDRYNFKYNNWKGQMRQCIVNASIGDGRPPIAMNLWGGINYTRVVIIYPFEKIEDDEDQNEIIITAVKIMNEIIETYRIVTNYYFVPNISLNDIKEYVIFIIGKGSTRGIKIKDTFSPYFKYKADLKKEDYSPQFAKYLLNKDSIPLHGKLISNSKRHFYNQNYQYSILESILALEIIVLNFLKKKYNKLQIKKRNINEFFIRNGITNTIAYIIPMLLSDKKKKEFIELLNPCLKVIEKRNKIMHKGEKNFETQEIANYIKTVEKVIKIIEDN